MGTGEWCSLMVSGGEYINTSISCCMLSVSGMHAAVETRKIFGWTGWLDGKFCDRQLVCHTSMALHVHLIITRVP